MPSTPAAKPLSNAQDETEPDARYPKDHSYWKENTPDRCLEKYVDPQDGIGRLVLLRLGQLIFVLVGLGEVHRSEKG